MTEDRILAIETSGRRGSVALGVGPNLVEQLSFAADAEKARDLLPTLSQLVLKHGWEPRDIGQCYVSIGPGSFTGLRVAVTFARHLSLAIGARLCAVPSLDVIAENCLDLAPRPESLAVVLDAKRRQVFGAVFKLHEERYARVVEACMIAPSELIRACQGQVSVAGEGIDYHREAFDARDTDIVNREFWWPQAACVHRLGWRMACEDRFVEASQLTPFYLRRPEAEELWEKRHGTGR